MAALNFYLTDEERARHEAKLRFRAFELPHMSREERDERLVELVGESLYVEHLEYENSRLERRFLDAESARNRAASKLEHLRGNVQDVCKGIREAGHEELADRIGNAILSQRRLDYEKMEAIKEAVCTTDK